jgi:bifunctional non-homologous end joining protein LigD
MPHRNHSSKKDVKTGTSAKRSPVKASTRLKAPKNTKATDGLVKKEAFSAIIKTIVPAAPKSSMPSGIKPMLATLVDEPFSGENWQFELKLDGYRALAYLNNGNPPFKPGETSVEIRSRNDHSFNKKFDTVYEALNEWKVNAVIDGEIVVVNEEGRPDFSGIQLWETKKAGQLVYYVFDLLWLEGINLVDEPLYKRREILMHIMPESGVIRYSDHIDEVGTDFFEVIKQNKLEGIIAKQKDSLYIPDSRSKSWLKIKAEEKHEAVICGYTKNKDSEREFSSLVLGIYKAGKLNFIGQVGTGFNQLLQSELLKKMRPLVTANCPFDMEPKLGVPTTWLKPMLVCEVKYTEITPEGLMRHASFQGLREDKTAMELNVEVPVETGSIVLDDDDDPDKPLVSRKKEEELVIVDDYELKLTNLKKLYWPKEKITKGDLLNYYYSMEEFIMPYMKDRPQSLNRFPNGINGESFYQKNMAGKVDKWLNTFERFSESTTDYKDFLICSNTASLIYMANLGCIEMNPWHSRVQNPHYPDWSVVDLDPGTNTFEQVIEAARVVHQVLKSLDIPSFPKTSGSTGIHIYIPLRAKYNYEQSKQLAELIANLVHEELPSFTSLERNPQKRTDKIYLDYLQNRPIQTICAPYSVRPKPGATVSAPLHWDEVKIGLKMNQFTLKNMLGRVKTEGDLFKGVLGKAIDLNNIIKGLSHLI